MPLETESPALYGKKGNNLLRADTCSSQTCSQVHCWQALVPHWLLQEILVLCHMGVSISCLNVLMTWQLASPEASDPIENKEETAMLFLSQLQKPHIVISTTLRS